MANTPQPRAVLMYDNTECMDHSLRNVFVDCSESDKQRKVFCELQAPND